MKIYIVLQTVDLGFHIEYVTLSKSLAEAKCQKYNDKWNKDFPTQYNKTPFIIHTYSVVGNPDKN